MSGTGPRRSRGTGGGTPTPIGISLTRVGSRSESGNMSPLKRRGAASPPKSVPGLPGAADFAAAGVSDRVEVRNGSLRPAVLGQGKVQGPHHPVVVVARSPPVRGCSGGVDGDGP